MNRPEKYKQYLEPDSDERIPSSTWYMHKKKLRTENEEDELSKATDEIKVEAMEVENSEHISSVENHDQNPEIYGDFETDENLTSLEDIEDKNNDVLNVVNSLVEDIDLIEIEANHLNAEQNEIADDYFEDNIDYEEDDSFQDIIHDRINPRNEEDNVLNMDQPGLTYLQNKINNKIFKQPIKTSADKTVGEVVLMILKFVLVHTLSLTAITDLFVMINCIFAEPFLPSTRYLIDKLFYPKNCTKLYATCTNCGAYIGKFDKSDSFLKCKICQTKINVKDKSYKDFFVMLDVGHPISKLIESNSDYYDYVVNKRAYKGYMQDIYDGKKYREFVSKLSEADKSSYATCVFNTDGAPLFKSSTYSIWPLFLLVNEVPLKVRTKDLILAGLWFGKSKPDMNVFLEPFVDQMNDLSTKGVQCIVKGVQMCIKIFTLLCSVDSVARAPVQGFTQYNGSYGCSQCLHPGVWIRNNPANPKSGNIKYPILKKSPKERNVKDTIEHMKKAVNSKKPVYGVKCPSQLINLMHFDIIHGYVAESLHCLSGIAKQFSTIWFGNKKKAGLLSRSLIPVIDKIIIKIKAPHQVVRLTRAFSEKEFWKAREWENWTLFYSMVVLKGILPHNLLMHWALFVEAFYILTKQEIQIVEIDFANSLLHEFVKQTEILYSKVAMTSNVHLLLHLSKNVYHWGPLWCHSAYSFESGNGDLLKVINAAKGIHHQICRRISLKYSFLTLKDYVYDFSSFTVKNYCNSIGTTMAKKTFQTDNIRYFGFSTTVYQLWLDKLHLSKETLFYKKIVKSGCLYVSSKNINERSNNSYALLKNGDYVKLIYFIVDTSLLSEYTIVQTVCIENAFNNVCNMLKKIVNVSSEETCVLTNDIAKVCVHMVVNENEYLSAVPNLHYY